jgi:hypothetical protein
MTDDIGELIVSGAYETGLITRNSVDSLLAVKGITNKIAHGLGHPSDSESVFLVSILADDSGSIFSKPHNAELVAQGHNDIVDELRQLSNGEATDDVLIHTRYLNGMVLNPYTTLGRAKLMDSNNYYQGGGTPLYDQSVIALGTTIAKTAQLTAMGAKVRTFTLLITDGDDRHSRAARAQSVRWIVGDMLLTGNHIVAAMGVSDGVTDFRAVFQRMGIKPGWILEVDDSRDAIRNAFREVAEKLALAAGSEDSFATLALGPGPFA